jgi:YHS domain-containing protein
MYIDERKAKAAVRTMRYGGATYYFCSPECQHDFEKNPGKFINMAGARSGAEQHPMTGNQHTMGAEQHDRSGHEHTMNAEPHEMSGHRHTMDSEQHDMSGHGDASGQHSDVPKDMQEKGPARELPEERESMTEEQLMRELHKTGQQFQEQQQEQQNEEQQPGMHPAGASPPSGATGSDARHD